MDKEQNRQGEHKELGTVRTSKKTRKMDKQLIRADLIHVWAASEHTIYCVQKDDIEWL